jgi:hypothetical protein
MNLAGVENMQKTLSVLILILASAAMGVGQTGAEDCPTIGVSGPVAVLKDGDSAVFVVIVAGKSVPSKLTYRWTVENGSITAGASEREVTVTVSGKTAATVEVGGLDAACGKTATAEVRYGNVKPSPILFDEFGKVKDNLLQKRLSALGDMLEQNAGAQAYFVNYGSAKDVEKRESSIRAMFGANASKTVFVNGGVEKDVRTRVWIVPPGAETSELN